ncbi:hypothetical protein AB7C87_08150 [Natrarchaeobius sp. A-rgal3]|uniref:hypothetical protein n=1 Tax=Natrarchaeobius versutus TaxID=1679078 RepID=UPI00350ED83A
MQSEQSLRVGVFGVVALAALVLVGTVGGVGLTGGGPSLSVEGGDGTTDEPLENQSEGETTDERGDSSGERDDTSSDGGAFTVQSSIQPLGEEDASLGPNLLENPACVVEGQVKAEDPVDWTVEQGEIECNEPEPDFMPDPIEGEYVFIDWEDLEPTTDESVVT